jgi:hypothetical protein
MMPSLAAWVGERRPRVWAWAYVLTVPIAGLFFWMLPTGSFYDSNLTREAGFVNDRSSIARLLTPAIQDQESYYAALRPAGLTWSVDSFRYVLELTSTQVLTSSVTVDTSGNISFTLIIFARTFAKNSILGESFFQVFVTLSTATEVDMRLPDNTPAEGFAVSFAKELDSNQPPPLNILLPPISQQLPPGETKRSAAQSVIYLPYSTAQVVYHLTGAANGNPKEASGLLIRMCYLSAVTITTLGFGDITPVSSFARAFVGIEAVLGVVLVGLFLNAVAQKWGKGSTRVPDLRLKFTLSSRHPNEARFSLPEGPDSPERTDAKECIANISVLNTSSYEARNPSLIIGFRGATIKAGMYAGSRGWTPTARDPATGDILALQWDGGPKSQIKANSTFGLPGLNLNGLSRVSTGMPEITMGVLADGYNRSEIVMAADFLMKPLLLFTGNAPPEWL